MATLVAIPTIHRGTVLRFFSRLTLHVSSPLPSSSTRKKFLPSTTWWTRSWSQVSHRLLSRIKRAFPLFMLFMFVDFHRILLTRAFELHFPLFMLFMFVDFHRILLTTRFRAFRSSIFVNSPV